MSSSDMTPDKRLVTVVSTLVERVGLRNLLLAISVVCAQKATEHDEDADSWSTVAHDLEQFARTSLRGLR